LGLPITASCTERFESRIRMPLSSLEPLAARVIFSVMFNLRIRW
jgi:hypothetical protein